MMLYFLHQTNQGYSATGIIFYTGSVIKDSGSSPVYLSSGNVFISAAILSAAYFPVSFSPLFPVPNSWFWGSRSCLMLLISSIWSLIVSVSLFGSLLPKTASLFLCVYFLMFFFFFSIPLFAAGSSEICPDFIRPNPTGLPFKIPFLVFHLMFIAPLCFSGHLAVF